MGSQPTLVINFFAYFIPFYFISKVFESKLLFSLAFCLHFKNGYLVVWNRYDISHFPKCGWKDRRMDGCFFFIKKREKEEHQNEIHASIWSSCLAYELNAKRKIPTHLFILFYFIFPVNIFPQKFF